MQDVTPWPESFGVSEPVARVMVDGTEVDVESVTVSSELDSAMPERVAAGGGGVVAATGTASILRAEDVAEAGFNPWGDARQFVNAPSVVVEAGYRDPDTGGVGCARQITAQVESLDGGATSNNVGLEFVDYTPLLDRDITIEPLLRRYPPLIEEGARRGAGLSPIYVTDRILRHCGFYATPRLLPQAVLSAPMMGSMVPERGVLEAGEAQTSANADPSFRPTPWGVGLINGRAWYAPDYGARGHGQLTSALHVSFLRDEARNPDAAQYSGLIELLWGSRDQSIHIYLLGNGRLSVRYLVNGVSSLVVMMEAAQVNDSEAFTVIIEPSGQATIHASNGHTVTGSLPLPTIFRNQSMDRIYVRATPDSHAFGGLQVAFSSTLNHTFQRTAYLDPPAYYKSLSAFPSQIEVNCLSLLKEQAEAELAAMWVDEFGHFRWRNRYQLQDSPPRGTLTSTDNLLDIPWSVPVRSVFSRVEIEHDAPTVTLRAVSSITVSDNRGSTLSNGDTESRFFEPPADQDWHDVGAPQWMGSTVNYSWVRWGAGSYRGGIVASDNNTERLAYSSQLSQTWAQIHPQRWLLSAEAHDLGDDEHIEQSFRDRPDLYGRFAGENLPIIRAKGLTQWEQNKSVGTALGPLLAPVFVHKVGPWIQEPAELRSLADWLAEHLTKPDVVLRSIPIVPDPRIQLGDVFWLEDQAAYHVRLRIVVMGKTLRYQVTNSGHEMTQEITCRVLAVERLGVRYDELETAWAGRDYSSLESAWSGQDYDALEADPLDRS